MTMPYHTATGKAILTSVLVAEVHYLLSRASKTLLAGSGSDRKVVVGEVLGSRLFDEANIAVAAGGGNTGNGTVGSIALAAAAKAGDYVLTCIEAAANAGAFQVVDPDGFALAQATVAVGYATDQIGFTIADGATDFAVGDTFTITVPAGDGKLVALDLTATNGSQRAYAVAAAEAIAPTGVDASILTIKRLAALALDGLVWPSGITAEQKAAALAELEAFDLHASDAA